MFEALECYACRALTTDRYQVGRTLYVLCDECWEDGTFCALLEKNLEAVAPELGLVKLPNGNWIHKKNLPQNP